MRKEDKVHPESRLTDEQSSAVDHGVEQDIEELKRLSGKGNFNGWKFDRDEIHERPSAAKSRLYLKRLIRHD